MKSSSSVGPRGFDLSEFGLSEIARPWLVVSAGCSPAAIWCNSPPAAGCESPVGAEPFFCLRFPDVLVVILLPLIDLLVVNVSRARSRLIIPSFCRVNQDFHFGFPATIDYTSDRLRESVYSYLMQDEPEPGSGFSYKMSLKGKAGMLGIDHQNGRLRSREPGADPDVPGGQWRGAVCRATARGSLRLGGADSGAAPVCRPGPAGEGSGAKLHRPDDGSQPGTGDAADHGLSPDRPGESGGPIGRAS